MNWTDEYGASLDYFHQIDFLEIYACVEQDEVQDCHIKQQRAASYKGEDHKPASQTMTKEWSSQIDFQKTIPV